MTPSELEGSAASWSQVSCVSLNMYLVVQNKHYFVLFYVFSLYVCTTSNQFLFYYFENDICNTVDARKKMAATFRPFCLHQDYFTTSLSNRKLYLKRFYSSRSLRTALFQFKALGARLFLVVR